MSIFNDSSITPSSMAFDFLMGISAILYVTNIAPIFFFALLCFILAGTIIGTICDCWTLLFKPEKTV